MSDGTCSAPSSIIAIEPIAQAHTHAASRGQAAATATATSTVRMV